LEALADLIKLIKEVIQELKEATQLQKEELAEKRRIKKEELLTLSEQSDKERREIEIGTENSRVTLLNDSPKSKRNVGGQDLESNNETFQTWKPIKDTLRNILLKIEIENIKFDTLTQMTAEEILASLAGDIQQDLEDLGNGLLDRFLKGESFEEMKDFIKNFLLNMLNERIRIFYENREDEEDE